MLSSNEVIKLVSTDGKVICTILGNLYGITLVIDVGTNLGPLDGSCWSSIAEMSEFDLFRMCIPDHYIWEVVVPVTNRYIDGPNMTLKDFYVWLGCHFFKADF